MNSVLKKTRSLLIFVLVNSTYERCNKYFVKMSKEAIAMMMSRKELTENVDKIIEAKEKKANSMFVIEFNWQSTLF